MQTSEVFKRLNTLNIKARRSPLTDRETLERQRLKRNVKSYIDGVYDDYANYCLRERYLEGKEWYEISDSLGHFTTDAVRKICERTIKKM